jgi:hypothetical protein
MEKSLREETSMKMECGSVYKMKLNLTSTVVKYSKLELNGHVCDDFGYASAFLQLQYWK